MQKSVDRFAPAELLKGTIERITFHNPENGFCVIKIKSKGQKDLITVVGNAAQVTEGEPIEARGTWHNHRQHGLQFVATSLQTFTPTNTEGMLKYLASGLIKGIGPQYAQRLITAFQDKVFEVIEHEPKRLLEVPGFGAKKVESILNSWEDQKNIRDIMMFLQSYGVGSAKVHKIYKQYGNKAISVIQNNPYQLAKDIHGIGFKTADELAQKLGLPPNSIVRARAGLNHTLLEALSNGSCGLEQDELIESAEKLLEIEKDILKQALILELTEKNLIADAVGTAQVIFLNFLWQYEQTIAKKLLALSQDKPIWHDIDIEKAIHFAEKHLKMELSSGQRHALTQLPSSKVLVITGGPGVGKTSLVKSILEIVKRKQLAVMLAAPTGRAAKRLSESTNMEAKTLHRLLEVQSKGGKFGRNADNPLECDLLIVDEVSMVDVPLMRALLLALPKESGLILVGDVDQLPSVGPGQVLKDIIESEVIPTVRLDHIFRQAATSHIITNAHKINKGYMPELGEPGSPTKELKDFYFIEAADPEVAQKKIVEIVKNRIPKRFHLNPLTDIQVLCPMNKSAVGAKSLNLTLQAILNPNTKPFVEKFGVQFHVGDKIIQTTNDYDKEIFNGDCGFIVDIDVDEQQMIIDFDGREVVYDFDEIDQIALAYALTIHKSQGSEYPAVVIPIMMQHFMMLKRNLLYTGITRGKKLVILVGQKKAIGMAVKGLDQNNRVSKLKEWLRIGFEHES